MKKIFTTLALIAFAAGASAQDPASMTREELEERLAYLTGADIPKNRYINLSYATQELHFGAIGDVPAETLKSDHGLAFEWGKTFFFHARRPIAGMIRIGLDWSWLDMQYASFNIDGVDENNNWLSLDGHFGNIGMQVGPSVTVTPLKWLNARAYVHYAPSVAAFSPSDFEGAKLGYAGYVTGGLQASFKFVTLGVEVREATAKLATIDPDAIRIDGGGVDIDDDHIGVGDIVNTDDLIGPTVKTKLPSVRFTLGFRF